MQINHLAIKNFRCFASFDLTLNPQFNLLVGDNGSGKTSILDALYIAAGGWLLGVDGPRKAPPIDGDEVRLTAIEYENGRFSFEKQYPVSILASGTVMGRSIEWEREKASDHSTTRYGKANAILEIGRKTVAAVRAGENVHLPLISAYGTERLWIEPDPPRKERPATNQRHAERPSRLDGYRNIQFLINEAGLFDWIETETLAGLQNRKFSFAFTVVKNAIVSCIEDASDLYYDVRRREVVVVMNEHGPHPYEFLSDGQRVMLSLVGDLAKKAITLNPHLNDKVLERTQGIVTIDELDLHLDPIWQRRVIRDLKRTFPEIQFIATTHSPQLVGEVEPNEIILLDAQKTSSPAQSFGMDSNWILRHVMGADERDKGVRREFDEIGRLITELKFEEAQGKISRLRSSIGNHPELVRYSARIDRLSGAIK